MINWGFPVFLSAANCEHCIFKLHFLYLDFKFSGHDLVDICNMESVQENPLCPPAHLCATCNCFLHIARCLLQPSNLFVR